jgi:hypothetical protein
MSSNYCIRVTEGAVNYVKSSDPVYKSDGLQVYHTGIYINVMSDATPVLNALC